MPTIAAIATPKGNGGIGIVRLSGPRSKDLLSRSFLPQSSTFENFTPWRLQHGKILDSHDEPLDDVLVVFMPGPATYTGEDVAEVHCHGGWLILQTILQNFIRLGARQAEPGEFTKRAFLNNRMDLSQAEAVAELIAAPSRDAIRYSMNRMDGVFGRKIGELRENLENLRVQATAALDFPDDEVDAFSSSEFYNGIQNVLKSISSLLSGHKRANTMQHGVLVALAGAVNAGKSSMLNALCGKNRALVCDLPGTTRDFLEEWIQIEGLPIRLCDTAGLRSHNNADTVENMGMQKSREILEDADAILLLLDGAVLGKQDDMAAQPDEATAEILELAKNKPVVVVWNKSDIFSPKQPPTWLGDRPFFITSCETGHNLDILCKNIHDLLISGCGGIAESNGLAPNARQSIILEEAHEELDSLLADMEAGQSLDLCLAHLDSACDRLGQIIGINSSAELLDRIFSSFCIGK